MVRELSAVVFAGAGQITKVRHHRVPVDAASRPLPCLSYALRERQQRLELGVALGAALGYARRFLSLMRLALFQKNV
jgi:hypothetical protein